VNQTTLRVDQGAERAAQEFAAAFVAGDGAAAKGLVADGFTWFGRAIDGDQWTGDAYAAFVRGAPMEVKGVRALSAATTALLPAPILGELLGGVRPDDRLVFVDVARGGAVTTSCAIVATEGKPKVRRVVDPTPFVQFVRMMALSQTDDAARRDIVDGMGR
jgi:hypothetical protein